MIRTDTILITPEVDLQKYFDTDEVLPEFASQHMVKKELEKHLPGVNVEVAETWDQARKKIARADIVLSDRLDHDLIKTAKKVRWVQSTKTGIDHFISNYRIGYLFRLIYL